MKVSETRRTVGVKTPYIDAVLALMRRMGEVAGVYPEIPAKTQWPEAAGAAAAGGA